MRRLEVVAGSIGWFVLTVGSCVVLIPYLLTGGGAARPLPHWWIAQAAGTLLILAGLIPLIQSFLSFARAGGSPMPAIAPRQLVVRGCYRHLRNPIYLGFVLMLVGEALVFGSAALACYAVVAWLGCAAVVHWYEEPRLMRRLGEEYQEYRRGVPAWLPRLHPWGAGGNSGESVGGGF